MHAHELSRTKIVHPFICSKIFLLNSKVLILIMLPLNLNVSVQDVLQKTNHPLDLFAKCLLPTETLAKGI